MDMSKASWTGRVTGTLRNCNFYKKEGLVVTKVSDDKIIHVRTKRATTPANRRKDLTAKKDEVRCEVIVWMPVQSWVCGQKPRMSTYGANWVQNNLLLYARLSTYTSRETS
jgi:hypothetical protein